MCRTCIWPETHSETSKLRRLTCYYHTSELNRTLPLPRVSFVHVFMKNKLFYLKLRCTGEVRKLKEVSDYIEIQEIIANRFLFFWHAFKRNHKQANYLPKELSACWFLSSKDSHSTHAHTRTCLLCYLCHEPRANICIAAQALSHLGGPRLNPLFGLKAAINETKRR